MHVRRITVRLCARLGDYRIVSTLTTPDFDDNTDRVLQDECSAYMQNVQGSIGLLGDFTGKISAG